MATGTAVESLTSSSIEALASFSDVYFLELSLADYYAYKAFLFVYSVSLPAFAD